LSNPAKPVIWTLEQALELIRFIQPMLHARKYHVALGGGVLNKGLTYKDLDLYFFPFDESRIDPLLPFLEVLWGKSVEINDRGEGYPPDVNFEVKVKFSDLVVDRKRIDVFITKNGVNVGS
jgi:hypothetical protein